MLLAIRWFVKIKSGDDVAAAAQQVLRQLRFGGENVAALENAENDLFHCENPP